MSAAAETAAAQASEALHARLSDLALVDPQALVAGLPAARAERLLVAFASDLRRALAQADEASARLLAPCAAPRPATARTLRAAEVAIAARLERASCRVAAGLEALSTALEPTG